MDHNGISVGGRAENLLKIALLSSESRYHRKVQPFVGVKPEESNGLTQTAQNNSNIILMFILMFNFLFLRTTGWQIIPGVQN